MRLSLALRNLSRHGLRTAVSCLMIAFSVCGIIIFKGFSHYNIDILAKILGEQQYGHVQIATENYWNTKVLDHSEKLLQPSEKLIQHLRSLKEVHSIGGRLSFWGLINTAETSAGAAIIGFDPKAEDGFRQHLRLKEGHFLESPNLREILIGLPLAQSLNVKPGDSVTLMSTTLAGVFNGMDFTVAGIFYTGLQELDGKVLFVQLAHAQSLFDTDQVDLLTIRGENLQATNSLLKSISPTLTSINQNLKSRPWYELSTLYKQVVEFYDVQNGVIESIIVMLILLGIANVIGMSIVERTGEIGTARALGETRADLIKQFILESTILAFFGALLGFLIAIGASNLINQSTLTMNIPGGSVPIPIKIDLVPWPFIYAFILSLVTTLIATLIPGVRASRMSIIEALRKNI